MQCSLAVTALQFPFSAQSGFLHSPAECSSINLHAHLHLSVCFLGNQTCDNAFSSISMSDQHEERLRVTLAKTVAQSVSELPCLSLHPNVLEDTW